MNALTEIKHIENAWEVNIIAAVVAFCGPGTPVEGCGRKTLHIGHSPEERAAFDRLMDREYDDGHGSQELYGVLWFSDGRWAKRGEYDGSEWWDVITKPIPPERKV